MYKKSLVVAFSSQCEQQEYCLLSDSFALLAGYIAFLTLTAISTGLLKVTSFCSVASLFLVDL